MPQMRIAHVAPPGVHPYSGLLTVLVHLASALAARNHRVEVFHFGSWSPEAGPLGRLLDAAGVERVALPAEAARFRSGRWVAKLVEANQVQLVHLHGVFNPYNNWIARQLPVPLVISPHGGYAPESLAYHAIRKKVFGLLFELPMLRRARLVCALNAAEAQDLRAFGLKGPVAVIPNGVAPVSSTLDRHAFRDELGVTADGCLAVYVGRMDVRAKRLDHLVRGVAAAPGWTLALVGGDFRAGSAQLRELSRSLGVTDRVLLVQPRRGQALLEALSAADLFVLLSRSEGMPMALLEAAACGVPGLVSSEVERAVGQVSRGAGWLVEPGRVAEALQALALQDSGEWNRRRRAAVAWADEYRWPAIAERMEQVYGLALDPAGSAALSGVVSLC